MGVDFAPIVHNSGSHGELQNLGLTPPNYGQTLGSKARAGANYRVADHTPRIIEVPFYRQVRSTNHHVSSPAREGRVDRVMQPAASRQLSQSRGPTLTRLHLIY
jgi:hypothetical protein